MNKKIILAVCLLFFNISVCWALPAPKYLSVPHWKSCAETIKQGSARFVCLPAKQPAHCPRSSWRTLNKQHLMMHCSLGR